MVLVYLPTFARTKSPSYVGKYTIHGAYGNAIFFLDQVILNIQWWMVPQSGRTVMLACWDIRILSGGWRLCVNMFKHWGIPCAETIDTLLNYLQLSKPLKWLVHFVLFRMYYRFLAVSGSLGIINMCTYLGTNQVFTLWMKWVPNFAATSVECLGIPCSMVHKWNEWNRNSKIATPKIYPLINGNKRIQLMEVR